MNDKERELAGAAREGGGKVEFWSVRARLLRVRVERAGFADRPTEPGLEEARAVTSIAILAPRR